MKKFIFNTTLFFVLLSAAIIVAGCKKTERHLPVQTSDVTHSGCKNSEQRTGEVLLPSSKTSGSTEITYDEAITETLHLKAIGRDMLQVVHSNVILNCCPGTLSADCHVEGQTIFVTEQESEKGCKCLCPYDLSYAISPLQAIEYTLQIKGYHPVSFRFSSDMDITFVLEKIET
ncbi:MAG: hypothetical protein GX102_11220 [Porphyromonadaceae bacterium]|jgi:hypothetical protein|nr:hypothetical protein [Porphyromonadaceae bacterium]